MAIRQGFYFPDFEDMGDYSARTLFSSGFEDPQAFMNYEYLAAPAMPIAPAMDTTVRGEDLRAQNAARLAAEQEAFMQAQAQTQPAAQPAPVEQPVAAPAPAAPVQDKASIINNLISQIQARSNTSQWSGGYGADEATKDMARILAETGITDISQFGPITQQVEKVVGYEDTGMPIYATVTEQTYGNKLTGQAVPNTYTERQTGEFFGGTYEGKGNTGYGVQFDAQGNPTFYTQGASSKDKLLTTLMPAAQLALLATGAGGLLGNTLLGAGANQVAAGALGGALLGGGTAALAGQDVLKGALLGGAGGALSGYLNPSTGQVSVTPTEGAIPVTGSDIAQLGSQGTAGYYNEITGQFISDPLGGLTGPLTNASSGIANISTPTSGYYNEITGDFVTDPLGGLTEPLTNATSGIGNIAPSTSGYYNEITGEFVNDPLGGLTEPLTNATSGTNIGSMDGYNYNPTTGDWTLPTGEVIGTTVTPNPVTNGGDIMRNAGALPPVAPSPPESSNALSNLSPSQLASLLNGAAGLFGALGATQLGGGGGGRPSMNVGALPTQGVPLNSQDYFNAIQQNYNTLMPAIPRDVSTPLANWYNSQYTGA